MPGSAWKQVASVTLSTAWDTQMLVSMANLGAAAADDMDVDYVYFSHRRDLTL